MAAEDVDRCMTLGAGMPMGPLALLDFVGLDVSQAIGETIEVTRPERLRELVREGSLGRKSGRRLPRLSDERPRPGRDRTHNLLAAVVVLRLRSGARTTIRYATYLIAAPPPQKHETGPSPAGRFLFASGAA